MLTLVKVEKLKSLACRRSKHAGTIARLELENYTLQCEILTPFFSSVIL
jgi:hypothetical protein